MNVEGTTPNRSTSYADDDAQQLDELNRNPPPPRRGMRGLIVPILIGLLVLGGLGWVVFNRFILPLLAPPPAAPPPTQVNLASPKSTSIADSSDYAATLDSRQSVTLQPRVSGQISAIYVKAGDRVEAGTPILQIDAAEQQAQVASRSAAVESAAADISVARADVVSARDTLNSLIAERATAVADVQLAQSEYQRYQDLFNQGASSQQISDQRLNALRSAQASLAKANADVQAQQGAIAREQANVVKNQRSLQQARATVNEGQAQLGYYTITAPFAGIVGNISAKEGDVIDPTSQMVRITQNRELEVQVAIPLDRAPSLRQGQPVQLLDEQNKVIESGRISFIAPDVDPTTQSVQAKATFGNGGGTLRTSQFVRVRVIWATNQGILVPTTAISRLGGRDFIFVSSPFNTSECPAQPGVSPTQTVAVQKPIELGKIIGNDQEVTKGLTARDRIVVSGILNLQNCMPIAAAPATPAPSPTAP